MAYRVYIDKMLLPVAPAKMSLGIANRNETVDLINGGEVNFVKSPGLSEITFEITLPAVVMPYADYLGGFLPISAYLAKFEALKLGKSHFPLLVSRSFPDGRPLHGTSLMVTLEEYEVVEDADIDGFDTTVSLVFRQWKGYGTQSSRIKLPCSYKTAKGDTLTKISKLFYGSSKYWSKIYKANKKKVKKSSKRSIKKGVKLTIPA
jgi:nucleoid-associated protein YgaU